MTTGKPEKLSAIPTNIISGFLGVGKTSAILSLLEAKPENERWAVLVNEFGEIGIDGGFFEGVHTEQSGVFVREVPGGCMCCASGLSMQIALNQLLARSRPHRLLIEPTGLGHPREVLEVLSAEHYQEVLNIQKNITLVDARKLTDIRYTLHETFNQQIDVADIVVGNKEDLYQDESKQLLINYVANRRNPMPDIVFAQHGKLAPSLLDGASDVVKAMKQPIPHHSHDDEHHTHENTDSADHDHHHKYNQARNINDMPLPQSGFVKIENSGEGFQSMGWRFSPYIVFNRSALHDWLDKLRLDKLKVERLKAIMITNEGIFSYNIVDDAISEKELDDCLESRIEVIINEQVASKEGADDISGMWEQQLVACQLDEN